MMAMSAMVLLTPFIIPQYTVHFQLELCTGKTEADFCPSPALLDKVATLSHPELFQDGWNDVKFFLFLRQTMETSGIRDFSWRDLHQPTSQRTTWQLSALINMVKFREDQMKFYLELHKPVR